MVRRPTELAVIAFIPALQVGWFRAQARIHASTGFAPLKPALARAASGLSVTRKTWVEVNGVSRPGLEIPVSKLNVAFGGPDGGGPLAAIAGADPTAGPDAAGGAVGSPALGGGATGALASVTRLRVQPRKATTAWSLLVRPKTSGRSESSGMTTTLPLSPRYSTRLRISS